MLSEPNPPFGYLQYTVVRSGLPLALGETENTVSPAIQNEVTANASAQCTARSTVHTAIGTSEGTVGDSVTVDTIFASWSRTF
jgi:hypothetical protein